MNIELKEITVRELTDGYEDNLKFSRHKEIKGKTSYNRYENYDAIDESRKTTL